MPNWTLNEWNGMGWVLTEPKTFEAGKRGCTFILSIARSYDRGTYDYIPCAAFGKVADNIMNHLHKGDSVFLQGSLGTNRKGAGEQKRYYTQVRVGKFTKLSGEEMPVSDWNPEEDDTPF